MTKNVLELSGRDLEKELDRIAAENPPGFRRWTEKENEVAKALKARRVSIKTIAKTLGRSYDSVKARWSQI